MANELVLINGVTKKERNGLFVYTFGNVIIDANPAKAEYTIFDTDKHQNQKVLFADITDKLGTADVVAYVDKLAADGYFQQVITGTITATIDPAGLATEAKQDEIITAIGTISAGDATAANQVVQITEAQTGNASLSSIDSKVAIEAKQDLQIIEAQESNILLEQIALNTLNTYQPEGSNRGVAPVNAFKNIKLTVINTVYLAYALQLKPASLSTIIKEIKISLAPTSNITMIWYILLNPTISGVPNYISDTEKTNVWKGDGNTMTITSFGTVLANGVLLQGNFIDNLNVVKDIPLSSDTLVLALEATVNNSNVYAYLNRIED